VLFLTILENKGAAIHNQGGYEELAVPFLQIRKTFLAKVFLCTVHGGNRCREVQISGLKKANHLKGWDAKPLAYLS
jgi:hypothetical protein